MIEIKEKKYKILFYVFLAALSGIFSIYYYGISKGVLPCHEELYPICQADWSMNQGYKMTIKNIYYIVCELVVYLCGIRYGSIRLVWSIFYFLISLFVLDLSIRDNQWKCRMYVIPLYMILMVFMHLSGRYLSEYYGKLSQFDQYPFNNHIQTTLASVIFLWIYDRVNGSRLKSKYKTSSFLVILIMLIGCYYIAGGPDTLLFAAQTIVPFFLLMGRKYIRDNGSRNKALILILLGAGVINLFIGFNNKSVEELMYLYHVRDIVDIKELFNQVLAYIACISGVFNFDMWAKFIDVGIFVNVIRIILVVFIYRLVYKNIKNYFMQNDFSASIDSIICWGITIVSIFFIFTRLGYWDRARYLNVFLPYGTILLCRNIESFLKFVKIPSVKTYLVIDMLVIFLSYNPEWGHHREYNEFDNDLQEINEFVEKKNLHEGLAPRIVYPCVTVQGRGKHKNYPIAYLEQENQFGLLFEMDYSKCFFDYFIVPQGILDDYFYSDNQEEDAGGTIKNIYGSPDEIASFNYYDIYIYYDGIDITFMQ